MVRGLDQEAIDIILSSGINGNEIYRLPEYCLHKDLRSVTPIQIVAEGRNVVAKHAKRSDGVKFPDFPAKPKRKRPNPSNTAEDTEERARKLRRVVDDLIKNNPDQVECAIKAIQDLDHPMLTTSSSITNDRGSWNTLVPVVGPSESLLLNSSFPPPQ